MADEIKDLLKSYHTNTLWDMADAAGLAVRDARGKRLPKSQIISLMQSEFFTEERVQAALKKLNERERAVLNRLQLRGGKCLTQGFARELMRAGLVTAAPERSRPRSRYGYRHEWRYEGNPRLKNSTTFQDVIARLTYRGLVFSEGAPTSSGGAPLKLQFHPGDTLLIPAAVGRYLPEPEPIPAGLPEWEPEQVSEGEPDLLLRDLYLYWDFVRRNEVARLKNGLVGKRSLKAINEALLLPDPRLDEARREDEAGRLYMLRKLLEGLNLVHMDRAELRLAQTDPLATPEFWSWPLSRQLKACLEAWVHLGGTEKWHKEAEAYYPRFAHARQTLLAAMQTLVAGAWFEIADLVERAQGQDVSFLFAERREVEKSRGHWYYSRSSYSYYGSAATLLEKFDEYEQRFVADCVSGTLHALGVVDLGYEGEALRAFRLTPGGISLLEDRDAEGTVRSLQEAAGKLIVQPNFQLVAIGPVNLGWLARLDLFAERERADRGAFEYRLSRDSVYQAQQLGLSVAEITRFVEEASGAELPQNVRRSLQEWGTAHERIVFRTGVSLLQGADADLLDRLMGDAAIADEVACRVSPDVALLKDGGHKSLVARLLARGLLPAVSGPEPQSADASVIVAEDGRIRSVHAVPGLHLRGRLAHLAEEEGEGQWRLTPESIRRAGGSRGKVNRVLDELSRLQRGALPEGLPALIKAWGGYYGKARAETLTLVQFRDQEALDELRRQPALGALLTPFPADKRALAVVPTERLAELEEILGRFGVRLEKGLRA
jgi:hypothetical protein